MKNFFNRRIYCSCKLFIVVFGIIACLAGCEDRFEDNPKYQRPDWLVGKIFSQIEANDSLSFFSEWIKDVGYDSVINKTGSYAAFIPNNDAVVEYLEGKGYSTIEDIPFSKKLGIVKYHLVQMPWNYEQLQELSRKGWINENDIRNNKPFAFKRQTLLRNDNKTYPVLIKKEGVEITETIVPENQSNGIKTVYTNSRKYVPIFFDRYFEISSMIPSDYEFYFNRSYEQNEMYYAGAKIISEEIFSDNGFVYMVDKVIEPLSNAEELMEEGLEDASYSMFKNLIYKNSEFEYNEDATYSQSGSAAGFEVEDLYNLTYDKIGFDIHQELTANPNWADAEKRTMENHFGVIVPTDDAMQSFIDDVLLSDKVNSIDDVPTSLKLMIINSHMSEEPIYESDINNGFYNFEGDLIKLNKSNIIQKEFGSNSTFIGVDKVITPKALSSVTGPLYLNPSYLNYLLGLEYSSLTGALKAEDIEFSLFVIPEDVLAYEQSMMTQWQTWRKQYYYLTAYSYGEEKVVRLDRTEVSEKMFNHIGVEPLVGLARKEFIETLNQKHIVVNNEDHTITGGSPSVFGYMGDSIITVNFKKTGNNYYNGNTYEIDGWLRFPSQSFITRMAGSKYFELLKKAGLSSDYVLKFVNETDRYTLFMPSDEALVAVNADTLTGNQLKDFLLGHIIKDELIFTDGRANYGKYRTMIKRNNDGDYVDVTIKPDINEITIYDQDLKPVTTVVEEEGKTNIIAVKPYNEQFITSAVIHKIDTVLTF